MILCTRRALAVAAALAVLGLLGFWVGWALDAMLVADVTLVVAIWADARLAPRPGAGGGAAVRARLRRPTRSATPAGSATVG